MKISVVVCSNNLCRYNDMLELFESIKKQTYKNLELVFVSDHNMELLDKVKKYLGRKANVKVIMNTNPSGLSNARNFGIKHSNGQIVSFVDDDAVLYPYWAKEVAETFNDSKIGCVAGDIKPQWMMKKAEWFPYELYWILSCSYTMTPKKMCEVRNGFGTNISFRRTVFNKVGMFNTKLGYNGNKVIDGEEVDFCIRLKNKTNYKVMFNPNVRIKHKVYPIRVTLKNIVKKSYGDGYAKALMRDIHKNNKSANSTENKYLKHLIFKFYPSNLSTILINPKTSIKRILFVNFCILSVALGFLGYRIVK